MTRMQRMRVRLPAVIALGSNLGDREQSLRDAVAAIDALQGVTVTAASSIVESAAVKPHGIDRSAPSYLNAVIRVRSSLDPDQLLDALTGIERDLGRVRGERWGDRTIDLDMITFTGATRDGERLTLPHPRAWQRRFVLQPWLEIAPSAKLGSHGPVADLIDATIDEVRPWDAAPLLPRGNR